MYLERILCEQVVYFHLLMENENSVFVNISLINVACYSILRGVLLIIAPGAHVVSLSGIAFLSYFDSYSIHTFEVESIIANSFVVG